MRLRNILITLIVLPTTAGTAPAEEETRYMAVFMDGKKIGYVKHTRKVAGGKVATTETMELSITRANVQATVRVKNSSVETPQGKPLEFESVTDLGLMTQTVKGTVKDGIITATTSSVGGAEQRKLPWPEGALMSEGLRLLSLEKGLKEGTTYKARIFMPSFMSAMTATIRVGATEQVDLFGRVVRLTKVVTDLAGPTGSTTTTAYVNKDMEALKTTTPVMGMNLELVECSREVALSKNEVLDFFDKLIISSPVSLAGAGSARSVTYHLTATGGRKLRIHAGDNQSVKPGEDGSVVLTVRPAAAAKGAAFPYKGKDAAALAALKPTRFVQSNHKAIIALARKAIGDTKDAAVAVKRIETFVSKYITQKNLSVGYASAAEVAASRQGDCTEHAVLAAALCRAVGIPAQVATGLAYVERFRGKTHVFVPHAWVNAYVGGKWVGLDAALKGYDARHIALAAGDGNPEDFFGIISTLGYFKIARAVVEN